MAWTNPLDKIPQIPQDYANHMLWSAFGWLILVVLSVNPNLSLTLMIALGIGKKIVDFTMEGESLSICIKKSVISAIGAMIPWAGYMIFVLHSK